MWLIDLPTNTEVLIGGLVMALLGLLVNWVAAYVPWLGVFLEKYKTEWGVTLAALFVGYLETNLPGGEYAELSVLGVQLVVAAILLALGKLGLGKAGVRGFK